MTGGGFLSRMFTRIASCEKAWDPNRRNFTGGRAEAGRRKMEGLDLGIVLGLSSCKKGLGSKPGQATREVYFDPVMKCSFATIRGIGLLSLPGGPRISRSSSPSRSYWTTSASSNSAGSFAARRPPPSTAQCSGSRPEKKALRRARRSSVTCTSSVASPLKDSSANRFSPKRARSSPSS